MILEAGRFAIDLAEPRVMGVLNVTPDSFSDGGRFLKVEDALRQVDVLVDCGADIIDIGGESTRPGAEYVTAQEEIDRILPVIEALADRFDIPLSVDTSKPEVMRLAASAGVSMINDIYALRKDGALDAAIAAQVPVCLMHMQGKPQDMQTAPEYAALPADVITFLKDRVTSVVAAGLPRKSLLVDPGFGFGKNTSHNLQILAKLEQFAELHLPLLVGLSRKSTLGQLTGKPVGERDAAGLAAVLIAVDRGANIVRTHDVAGTVDALKVRKAVRQHG